MKSKNYSSIVKRLTSIYKGRGKLTMGNGIKLFAMLLVGFVLIEIGLTGRLGSILGAFIVPQYMAIQQQTQPATASVGQQIGGGA